MFTILRSAVARGVRLNTRLPAPLQDAAFSLYGAYQHFLRYGSEFRRARAELEASQWWTAEQIESDRRARLGDLLAHCAVRVPYYRGLFARLGLREEDLRAPGALQRLPILEKEIVRASPAAFVAEGTPRWRTISKGTAGTTGSPMVFLTTRPEIERYWAFADRARAWTGSALGRRRATFSGVAFLPPGRKTPPFWRRDLIENKAVFSIYHLSPETVGHYVRFLNRFRPEEMLGHPSCLSLLARLWPADEPPAFRPLVVTTTGESLYRHQKDAIVLRFGCRVSDQYSAGGEMGPVISMCEVGRYHEHPESGVIELLDAAGEAVPEGRPGDIVITGFVNRTMPLIRYRTGDASQARPRGDACPCGRASRTYAWIQGKIADRLILPDGRVLGNVYSLVESFPKVRECQFRQQAVDRIRLDLVPEPGFGPDDLAAVRRMAEEFLGPRVRLDCDVRESIPRTSRGKLRLVVSEIVVARLDGEGVA